MGCEDVVHDVSVSRSDGIEGCAASSQAAMETTNANKGPPPIGFNGNGHTTGLLHPGAATSGTGAPPTAMARPATCTKAVAAPRGVEMARY